MHEDLKLDFCRGARVLFRNGLSVGIAGHLSTKIAPNRMIANRFGPSFGTLTPKDLLTLDLEGNIIEGEGSVNDTIRLHGVIHHINPDIIALAHTHPPAVVTYSTLRTIPEIYDQESCFLAGEVGIVEEDYSGLASKEERVRPFADTLRKYHAAILPNHGAITKGQNIPQAIILMLLLEGMAMRNLTVAGASRATGIAARPISPEIAQLTKKELMSLKALPLVWADLMAKLRATDPDLFSK
jgi:ribulose-5-phosphate 4-epimerase/fuculose-1-phosphate aldolase